MKVILLSALIRQTQTGRLKGQSLSYLRVHLLKFRFSQRKDAVRCR